MATSKLCLQCGTEYGAETLFCPRDGSALKAKDPGTALIGQVVAERFLVQRELGQGGMGQVFLAEQVRIGRRCALKVIREGLVSNADAVMRFNREASNAARISHPNVVQVYDFGESREGLIFLAMEYVEGESLAAALAREGALAPLRAVAITAQVASALAAAHELKIVHRDLKPDNVMLARNRDGSDQVKVVDFGVSRVMDAEDQKVTGTGLVIGTPEYMSPEQFSGTGIDGRSDLYSLAMILFRMLTGEPPFLASNAREALDARFLSRPKRLTDARPHVAWPPGLQEVLDRAMAVRADDRYQTVEDFAAAVVAVTSYWDPDEGRAPAPVSSPDVVRAAALVPHSVSVGNPAAAAGDARGGREERIQAAGGGASAPPAGASAGAGATAILGSDPSVQSPAVGARELQDPSGRANAPTRADVSEAHAKGKFLPAGLLWVGGVMAVAVVGIVLSLQGRSGDADGVSPALPSVAVGDSVAPAPSTDSAVSGAQAVDPAAEPRQSLGDGGRSAEPPRPGDRGSGGSQRAAVPSPEVPPPASAGIPGDEPAAIRASLARLAALTDSGATPQQATEALRLARTVSPTTREGRVEVKFRTLEANILLDRTDVVCSLLAQLRFEAQGTRFEGAVGAYASVARESCP